MVNEPNPDALKAKAAGYLGNAIRNIDAAQDVLRSNAQSAGLKAQSEELTRLWSAPPRVDR